MAKDNPDNQTVPLYDRTGNITGYTTPDKAEGLAGGEYASVLDPFAGQTAAADYMGLDASTYQNEDGSWDFTKASKDAGAATAAGSSSSGVLQFGGVGSLPIDMVGEGHSIPTVDNPQPVPDTDFAGGMPDIITNPTGGAGSPSGVSDFSGFEGGTTGVDSGYDAIDWGGQESPWQGGGVNQNFYNDQFGQLLGQRNDFQQQQQQARDARENAANSPFEPGPADWSWANSGQGLKDVTLGTGQPMGTGDWRLAGQKGDTNQQLFAGLGDIWNEKEGDAFAQHFRQAQNPDSQYWGSFDNPTDFMSAWKTNNPDAEGAWTAMNQKLANNLFTQAGTGAGANIPIGYAAPV